MRCDQSGRSPHSADEESQAFNDVPGSIRSVGCRPHLVVEQVGEARDRVLQAVDALAHDDPKGEKLLHAAVHCRAHSLHG